jgi:hypothetical protein
MLLYNIQKAWLWEMKDKMASKCRRRERGLDRSGKGYVQASLE